MNALNMQNFRLFKNFNLIECLSSSKAFNEKSFLLSKEIQNVNFS